VQAVMAQRNEGVPVDRRMLFRIGINFGDILIEGDDILGDGVIVAAGLRASLSWLASVSRHPPMNRFAEGPRRVH